MESDTALQAYVIYRNPWQTEELLGEQTSRKTNLQQIVCGLELCAYITLSSKFTKYANYENVPSTTIHFLEKIILFQSYQTATEENTPTCPSPSMLIFLDLINALKRIEYY